MVLPRLLTSLILFSLSFVAMPARAMQTCPLPNDLATPDADFTNNGDGTVTHAKTGLMWKQCIEGLSGAGCATGTQGNFTWTQAVTAAVAASLDGFAGYSDWRLPNINELQSIVETGCITPAININRFPNPGSNAIYWSSTTVLSTPAYARYTILDNGSSHGTPKFNTGQVRLVRGGTAPAAFDAYGGACSLDVDGNGAQDALTDGLMILRAMFGLTGTSVTNAAVGAGATRSTWAQIRPYLNGSCGANFSP